MPKMTHWNTPDPIDVPAEKAAVYAAQGWVAVDQKPQKVQPAVVTRAAVEEPVEAPVAAKKAAKKAAAKKASKKS